MAMLREAVAAGFGLASKVRGTKVFHPHGVAYDATVRISGAPGAPGRAPFLSRQAEYRAIVRLSRGAGVPRPLPDVLGLAIRILDAHGRGRHQDLLMVTSGDGALVQHLLLPAADFTSLPYSCLIPYRIGGELYIVGARARSAEEYELGVAPLGRRLRPVGTVALVSELPDSGNAIRFDISNTGGGLQPATFLTSLRKAAYRASQEGWSGAEPEALTDEEMKRTVHPPSK